MTESTKSMTAEETIRAGGDFAEEIVGHWAIFALDQRCKKPTAKDLDELKEQIRKRCVARSVLKTDRMQIAKRLREFKKKHYPQKPILGYESDYTWAECETDIDSIIKELESKSEMR